MLLPVVCCVVVPLFVSLAPWVLGGRQGERGPELCVRQLRVCVSCELVCVCVSLVRAVIVCLASTHTALVSSPSLTVLHLPTYTHMDTSQHPTHGLVHALRPARLLEAERSALASHVTPCRLLCCCALVCALGTVCAGGGDREDVALSYVYANSGCVAANWLCVL